MSSEAIHSTVCADACTSPVSPQSGLTAPESLLLQTSTPALHRPSPFPESCRAGVTPHAAPHDGLLCPAFPTQGAAAPSCSQPGSPQKVPRLFRLGDRNTGEGSSGADPLSEQRAPFRSTCPLSWRPLRTRSTSQATPREPGTQEPGPQGCCLLALKSTSTKVHPASCHCPER